MIRPVMTPEEAEWRNWKTELERRHKLKQDEKEYNEWKNTTKNEPKSPQKQKQSVPKPLQTKPRFAF